MLRKFRLLALVPVLALIALSAWTFASPVGSSPDDDFHLISIWCANETNVSACKPGANADQRIVPEALPHSTCYVQKPAQSAACVTRYLDMSSKPTAITKRGNFQHNYPPVYYATMSLFVGPNIAVSALIMRTVNVLLFVAMTTALFLLLPRERRPTLIWAWVISTVPLGLFLIASNNPMSWSLIGIGSAWLALLGYFETNGRRKLGLGILFAIASLMAAGSRGDGAMFLGLSIVVVMILTFVKTRRYLLSALLPFGGALAAVLFYFSSAQAEVAVTGLPSAGGPPEAAMSTLSLLMKDLVNVPNLWAGVLGGWGLGWLDTAMPALVILGGVVSFVGVAFIGISRISPRKAIALGLVAVVLWLLPTYILVKGSNVVGQNVQPRYLLPLMLLLAGLVMLKVRGKKFEFTGLHLAVVVCLLSVAESLALYTNIRRYVTGLDVASLNLDTNAEWWWSAAPAPMAVWAIGSLAYAALLIVLAREMSKFNVAR